jgi:serine protease Do
MKLKFIFALICLTTACPSETPYIDDRQIGERLSEALEKSARDGRSTPRKKLATQMKRRPCRPKVMAPEPTIKLGPGPLYKQTCPGVAIISSAWKTDDGKRWEVGLPATAWVLSPDGWLVTNHHVFNDPQEEAIYGVILHDGSYHDVVEIMAADAKSDVAIFRIEAENLTPLPLAEADEAVGQRIGVISHPDSQFFTFTQGEITRYTVQHDEKHDLGVRFMSVSADFARGSSGGPVINSCGAVVGMVCSTQTTYYGEKGKDEDDDVQMVVKFCIPAAAIRNLVERPQSPRAEIVPEPR